MTLKRTTALYQTPANYIPYALSQSLKEAKHLSPVDQTSTNCTAHKICQVTPISQERQALASATLREAEASRQLALS